jgi:hypothetical protein
MRISEDIIEGGEECIQQRFLDVNGIEASGLHVIPRRTNAPPKYAMLAMCEGYA